MGACSLYKVTCLYCGIRICFRDFSIQQTGIKKHNEAMDLI